MELRGTLPYTFCPLHPCRGGIEKFGGFVYPNALLSSQGGRDPGLQILTSGSLDDCSEVGMNDRPSFFDGQTLPFLIRRQELEQLLGRFG